MSSPTLLAGQKPTTALAVSHFSSMSCFSMACASSNRWRAASPYLSSLRMRGIGALQLPGLEERRPVDIAGKLGEIVALEAARAEKGRLRRHVAGPIELELVGARIGDRGAHLLGLTARVGLRHVAIVLAHLGDRLRPLLRRHQARHHANGTARHRSRRSPGCGDSSG